MRKVACSGTTPALRATPPDSGGEFHSPTNHSQLLEQHHALGIDLDAAPATAACDRIVNPDHVVACVFESSVIVRIGPWRK